MILLGVERKIVLPGVIVGQVDVPVLEKTVGRHKIIRFVAGKRYPLRDEDESGRLIDKEGDEE